MNIRTLKNICLTAGLLDCVSVLAAVPQIARWILGLYILFCVALWLGDDA